MKRRRTVNEKNHITKPHIQLQKNLPKKFNDEELQFITTKLRSLSKENSKLERIIGKKLFDEDFGFDDHRKSEKQVMLDNWKIYMRMTLIIDQLRKDQLTVPVNFHRDKTSEIIDKNKYKYRDVNLSRVLDDHKK